MAKWLERAKREIRKNTSRGTANTDERDLVSETAVPQSGRTENSEDADGSVLLVAEQVQRAADKVPPTCWNCGAIMTITDDIYGNSCWVCWECAKSA